MSHGESIPFYSSPINKLPEIKSTKNKSFEKLFFPDVYLNN
jgi:hypothetical protein